jgi:MFS transporter, MHS family, shikimate and dehydroshikimate transport protein
MSDSTPPARPGGQSRRATLAAFAGTALEWFDYGLYGLSAALIFGPVFFSQLGATAGVLASLATFGVGFVARPVGGIIFGTLGDRIGRKTILIVCISMIGVSTFLVGVLPTYAQVGVIAPILLVTLRIIQGLGAGVELAASLTFVTESSKAGRRGVTSSLVFSGQFVGSALGTLVFLLVSTSMSSEDLLAWGWRIPYLASIVALAFVLIVRATLRESDEFIAERVATTALRFPLADAWRTSRRNLFANFLLPSAQLVGAYLFVTFPSSYLVNTLGLPPSTAPLYSLVLVLSNAIAIPFLGMLVDRLGARRMFWIGIISSAVVVVPYFLFLTTGNLALILPFGVLIYLTSSTLLVPQGAFARVLFPTRHRLAGFATSREVSSAVFAGPAPLIASALVLASGGSIWLVIVFFVVALVLTTVGLQVARPIIDEDSEVSAAELEGAAPRV